MKANDDGLRIGWAVRSGIVLGSGKNAGETFYYAYVGGMPCCHKHKTYDRAEECARSMLKNGVKP